MTNTAVCIICRDVHRAWLNFLNSFTYYDVYIVVDNNTDEDFSQYPNVKIIQIHNNNELERNGFTNSSTSPLLPYFPKIIAWDKALYHFSSMNLEYQHVWFIEDDCFFLSENTLKNIDNQYIDEDLITKDNIVNNEENPRGWHWSVINHLIKSPRCNSLIQTCRLSKCLLQKIKSFANEKGQLFFIECMFTTLAYQNNLKIVNPVELSKLSLNVYTDIPDVNEKYVYHAVKKIENHEMIRKKYRKP
jgi:hypothetical protein